MRERGAIGVLMHSTSLSFQLFLFFFIISPVIPATAQPMCPSSWYIFSRLTPIALVSRSC